MIVLFEKKDKKGPHILFHSMLSYVLIDAHLYTFSTAVFMRPGTWLCFWQFLEIINWKTDRLIQTSQSLDSHQWIMLFEY